MTMRSSLLLSVTLAMVGVPVASVAAQDELAGTAAGADRDLRESRAALMAGLDRLVERSTLEYGAIRVSREIAALGDEDGRAASCLIAVEVRTPQFDGLTMEATASTCEKASKIACCFSGGMPIPVSRTKACS